MFFWSDGSPSVVMVACARKYVAEVRDTSFLGGSSVRRSKKILERISITVIPC